MSEEGQEVRRGDGEERSKPLKPRGIQGMWDLGDECWP